MDLELLFIPIVCILSIIDVYMTITTAKRMRKLKPRLKIDDFELNKIMSSIMNKFNLTTAGIFMGTFTCVLLITIMTIAYFYSELTYIMSFGVFVGAYFIIIRLHIHNFKDLKIEEQKIE